jgi:HSP20 family protein
MARSMTPYRERTQMRPEVFLFGPLQRQIERLFEDFGVSRDADMTALVPRIDVSENDRDIQITVEMPGLERGDVEISLEGNLLTIRGEKRDEHDEEDREDNVRIRERTYGVFLRAIELPEGIDPESIQATMDNGVLRLTIPKPARTQPQRIEVKDGGNGGSHQGSSGSSSSGKSGSSSSGKSGSSSSGTSGSSGSTASGSTGSSGGTQGSGGSSGRQAAE